MTVQPPDYTATPEAPHLTGRVGGPPPGEAGGLQVSSALTPVAAVVIILTGRPRSPPLSMREVMVAQLAVLGFDITTQFLLSSDWKRYLNPDYGLQQNNYLSQERHIWRGEGWSRRQ